MGPGLALPYRCELSRTGLRLQLTDLFCPRLCWGYACTQEDKAAVNTLQCRYRVPVYTGTVMTGLRDDNGRQSW